jgi:hypothetical protein
MSLESVKSVVKELGYQISFYAYRLYPLTLCILVLQ